MKRIETPNRAVGLFSAGKDGFRSAVPGVSSATEFSALWFNHVQEAIVRTIEAAGLELSDTDFDQFLLALRSPGVFQTAPQFDNDTSAATTEFVNRALGSFSGVVARNANATLTAADVGKSTLLSAPATAFIMPLANACPAGSVLHLFANSASDITVSRQGADVFAGLISTTSITLKSGDGVSFRGNGINSWLAYDGCARLHATPEFAASRVSAGGYQKLPGGLVLQWGTFTASASAGAAVAVTFPLQFTECYRVMTTAQNAATANTATWYDTPTTTGFNGRCIVASKVCDFFAIGII